MARRLADGADRSTIAYPTPKTIGATANAISAHFTTGGKVWSNV